MRVGEDSSVSEPLRVQITHGEDPVARELIAAMIEDLLPLYGRIDGEDAPSAKPEEMGPPSGSFVVLHEGSVPVAGGGVKRLDDENAEIKRMYVRPDARGRGVARRLLSELETSARNLGYTRVRLDTGPRQPHALALYLSAGYREIPDYNGNPFASYWFEKEI
jgi:GNAT superfamily N-acetyltransferase